MGSPQGSGGAASTPPTKVGPPNHIFPLEIPAILCESVLAMHAPEQNIIAFPAPDGAPAANDALLMARIASHDDDAAFDALARRYYPPALALARSRLRDDALAQDVVQETFLRVFRERRRYDPARPFAAWFYTILRNSITDAARRRLRHWARLDLFAATAATTDAAPAPTPDGRDAAALLAVLPPGDQEVLILHYLHGLPLREVAALTGVTEEAAKKRAQRALKKVRATLAPGTPQKQAAG